MNRSYITAQLLGNKYFNIQKEGFTLTLKMCDVEGFEFHKILLFYCIKIHLLLNVILSDSTYRNEKPSIACQIHFLHVYYLHYKWSFSSKCKTDHPSLTCFEITYFVDLIFNSIFSISSFYTSNLSLLIIWKS